MKIKKCDNCEKPCEVIEGFEHVPDEFGMQSHCVLISECCCAEIYEEEVSDDVA